jgi:hypothetical protein
MQKTKLFIFFVLIVFTNATAQHCKFDAMHVLVIQLVNAKGKPRTKGAFRFFIKNINDKPIQDDAANFCAINWVKHFDTCANVLLKTDDAVWNSYAKRFTGLAIFKTKECYAVILTDAELKCLFGEKEENNKIAISRKYKKFERIGYYYVTKKNIYPLCSSYGDWKNIKPFKITVSDKNPNYGY